MKITFAVDGEAPEWGVFKKGDTRDLDPKHERKCIERTIDKDGTKLAYLSSSPEAKAIKEEVEKKKSKSTQPEKIEEEKKPGTDKTKKKGKEDKKNG